MKNYYCIITPYSTNYSDEDNTKRYKSMLSKLVYESYKVYCFADKKNGFFVDSNGGTKFGNRITNLCNEFNTNIIFLTQHNIDLSNTFLAPYPKSKEALWKLGQIATKNWEDL